MRPIKFRGKRLDNGVWIYGSLDLTDERPTISWLHTDEDDEKVPWFAHVKADTVGQFTGLHDKNGKEIYEGDIIEITDPNTNEKYISTVIWSRKGYYAAKMENNGNITLGYVDKSQIRIIGNLFDNPELLKQINLP